MKAFGENIILRPSEAPAETAGGLVLPASAGTEYKCRGFITNVGPGAEGVEVGQEIIFTTGSKFTVDGTQFIVVATKDILVVL